MRLVPTGQAAVDEATKRALARVGMSTEGEEPVEAVVSLVSHPAATALARQWQAPLLTLAIGGAAGPRRLELPTVAAAGRSVELLLVAVSPRGGPLRQLVAGAVKSSGLAPQMTVQRILTTCADWPARALADGSPLVSRELPDAALGAAGAPAWLGLPLHAARNAVERVRDMLTEETWAIGIAPRPVASFLERPELDDVVWLPERAGGGFLADPFGMETPAGPIVLAEAYVPETRCGEIVALRLQQGSLDPVRTGLSGHLSYPCLIEDGGELYCLPENSSAGRVTLLRAARFPEQFEPVAVLLDDFAGVDCTPFRHEGRWWMLAMNHADQDVAKLFLFHAGHLLGPWQPHPWNPVRCDVRNARPAGPPFLHEGRLYRPTQDCSRHYGGAVVLQRIDVLTTEWFHETRVARIEPDPNGPYPDGVHTLTALGATQTLVDGKRTRLRVG
ncbi:MAG: hypothetical protein WAS21_30475 [Geminicoccaceae bacterium]